MTEWVSQSEAVKLLEALGDKVSQPALSQYLKGHPEVPVKSQGPGKAQLIDWAALKRSRATRAGRGPASLPDLVEQAQAPAPAPAKSAGAVETDELSKRKAQADTSRAESEARRARVLAEEAEGRVVNREVAAGAFMAAGVALVRALEENARVAVDEIRAAKDTREAAQAMARYQRLVRTTFANALTEYAAAADPSAVAAE